MLLGLKIKPASLFQRMQTEQQLNWHFTIFNTVLSNQSEREGESIYDVRSLRWRKTFIPNDRINVAIIYLKIDSEKKEVFHFSTTVNQRLISMGFLFIFIVMVQTATPLITNRVIRCASSPLTRVHTN